MRDSGGDGGGLFLGVDAGATRCRARLRDGFGHILAEAEGPAANAYVDFARAGEVAREVVAAALARAPGGPLAPTLVRLGLGVAGLAERDELARFRALFDGFGSVEVVNDAAAACLGAHGGADGGLVIAGTGSAGVARIGDQTNIVGGRGFHLGDDGSAARLGLDASRAALRAADGLGPESELTRAVRARLGSPARMVEWAAAARPADYGALAPLATAAAAAGDPLALALVGHAARAVEALAAAVERLGARRLAFVGGLSAAIRPFLAPAVEARLGAPLNDPTDGAVALAGGRLPGERL